MKTSRPPLPAELRHPSLRGTAGIIAHALGMFLVPAVAAAGVVSSDWPGWAQAPLVLLLALWASQGLHLLAFLGHEGFHFSMHSNKVVSSAIGVVMSSMTPGHFDLGFAISHWNHHRFTNREGDPDAAAFAQYRRFGTRLLFARLHASRMYAVTTLRLALGLPLSFKYKFPLRKETVRKLAWLNILCSGLFLSLYVGVALYDPWIAAVSIGLPAAMLTLLSGLRPYLEHAGTDHELYTQARSRTAWITTALFAGTNYHLEHHLYPSVPCYRLPAVHRWLRGSGHLDPRAIETTIVGAVRHTTHRSQYPRPIAA